MAERKRIYRFQAKNRNTKKLTTYGNRVRGEVQVLSSRGLRAG